jgi:hypothetical protein
MIGLGIFCVIRNSRRHGSEQLGSVLGDYNEKPSRLDKVLPAFYIRRRDAELEPKYQVQQVDTWCPYYLPRPPQHATIASDLTSTQSTRL